MKLTCSNTTLKRLIVFNPDKNFEQEDAAISSIYFDNEVSLRLHGQVRCDALTPL